MLYIKPRCLAVRLLAYLHAQGAGWQLPRQAEIAHLDDIIRAEKTVARCQIQMQVVVVSEVDQGLAYLA